MLFHSIKGFRTLAGIYFLCVATVYIYFRSSNITFGDGICFLSTIEKGVHLSTTATSHFLYINFLHLFYTYISPFDSFESSIFFSLFFGLATLLCIYKSAYVLSSNKIASIMSFMLLAFSFTFWRQSEIIEVYTTNCFVIAWLFSVVFKSIIDGSQKIIVVSILLAIALLVHIQNILLIPFYLFYLYEFRFYSQKLVLGLLSFTFLCSLLFVIPLVFKSNSLSAVFFLNDRFQEKAISFDLSIIGLGFIKSLGYFIYNFNLFILFIVHGLIILYRKNVKLFITFFLAGAPFWGFAMKFNVTDNYVFFLIPYMLCCIAASYSFDYFLNKIPIRIHRFAPLLMFLLIPFYYLTFRCSLLLPQVQKFDQLKSYKGGVKYYLWPGMRDNADMIKAAYNNNLSPEELSLIEWNFQSAKEYVESKKNQRR